MEERNDNSNPSLASKQRLRWTHELHERFIDAVAELGGPDRATPKGVLRVMGVQNLTIYHVKSHLQKYRLAKFIPDSSSDGKQTDKKESGDVLPSVDGSFGVEISEALKLQMEVQKRLYEQLEVQRQLQLRIEAQGNYLKKIIEEQQRLSGVAPRTPPAPTSESPLIDKKTDSNYDKKTNTDSEYFASHHEPLTPNSEDDDTEGQRLMKKQRIALDVAYPRLEEMMHNDQQHHFF